jgi:hypothetical protein
MCLYATQEDSIFSCRVTVGLRLKSQSVCSILCKCGQVYIGQTGSSIETRVEGHCSCIHVEQANKLEVAVYSFNPEQHFSSLTHKCLHDPVI